MAFWTKYPYLNINDLNLDYLLRKVKEISDAKNVTYDDEVTALGSDNVQGAIDALKVLIDTVSTSVSSIAVVDDILAATTWENGATFTHLQTVNNTMFMAIINAIREDKLVVIRSFNGDDYIYYTLVGVDVDNVYFTHKLYFFNLESQVIRSLTINGLNDDANVFMDVNADVPFQLVYTFNGRDGHVTAETGDYTANQVDYDNSSSGLTAADVQGAIDEVDTNVDALVTRVGNVENAVAGKQDQLTFDATPQLGSDNPVTSNGIKLAIINSVAGVADFNGRTGNVIPAAHDYDADQIDYDNTASGLTATDVQAAIDELAIGTMVTITLILNGAKEDAITIYDSNNTQVGTCIFASGQTQGTCQIDVPVGGGSYKFKSSVAKDTTTGTTDYEQTITLTDVSGQTVNLYPANALYWYGNKLNCVTFRARLGVIYREAHAQIVERTNSIYLTNNSDDGGRKGLMSDTTINVSAFTTLKMLCETTLNTNNTSYTIMDESTSISVWDGNTINEILSDQTEFTKQIKSGTLSATGNKYIIAGNYSAGPAYPINTEIWALWLE